MGKRCHFGSRIDVILWWPCYKVKEKKMVVVLVYLIGTFNENWVGGTLIDPNYGTLIHPN